MNINQQRYEKWINGDSFKDLASEYSISNRAIIEGISNKIKYRLSIYLIKNRRDCLFGNICVIKEVNEAIQKYKYKEDKDPCYCLYNIGIYKRNENLFRKLAKALDAKSLKVFEENKYNKLIHLYTKDYKDKNAIDMDIIEVALNNVPESFKLNRTQVFGDKRFERMYGIYDVPVLTINQD